MTSLPCAMSYISMYGQGGLKLEIMHLCYIFKWKGGLIIEGGVISSEYGICGIN